MNHRFVKNWVKKKGKRITWNSFDSNFYNRIMAQNIIFLQVQQKSITTHYLLL